VLSKRPFRYCSSGQQISKAKEHIVRSVPEAFALIAALVPSQFFLFGGNSKIHEPAKSGIARRGAEV
jgi:hypothetical protein